MQSRRVWLPKVDCLDFDEIIQCDGGRVAEPGGRDPLDEPITTVLIGPEGGFDRDELTDAVPKIELSARILRVETAAIVAAARCSPSTWLIPSTTCSVESVLPVAFPCGVWQTSRLTW